MMTSTIPVRMTDSDCLLAILQSAPGWWMPHHSILELCQQRYGHGLTIHSRVSTLRKRGYDISCKIETVNGRKLSYYRLEVTA